MNELELHEKISDMEGDIRVFVSTLSTVAKSLGIDIKDLSNGDIMLKLPVILGKISTQMMMGTFDTAAIASLSALLPILEKYKPLVEDIIA